MAIAKKPTEAVMKESAEKMPKYGDEINLLHLHKSSDIIGVKNSMYSKRDARMWRVEGGVYLVSKNTGRRGLVPDANIIAYELM